MTDRIPGAPGRYQAMFTDGELAGKEFTVTLRRDDAPIAEGTPYNKANVLPDALASQLCPGMEDPAPKDAFAALQAGKADIGRRKSGSKITLRDAASAPVTGLRIFGHAVGDGCIGDKGDITVKFASKNLFNFDPTKIKSSGSSKGTLLEVLDNGVICQGRDGEKNGTASWGNGWFTTGDTNRIYVYLRKGDTVTISADYTMLEYAYSEPAQVCIHLYEESANTGPTGGFGNAVYVGTTKRIKQTLTTTFAGYYYPIFTLNSGKVKIENIQIEYGDTATDYAPYVQPQTITVPTPGGLEGDELVRDEIDFGKGVLIRRVFENSEIPLPADVLEAYGKLRTYAPTTIITNDEDADMEVHYCTPQTAVPMVCSPNDRGKILAIDDNGAVSLQTMASYVEYVEKSDGWDTRIWTDGFLEMYKKDTEGATIGQNGLCVIEYVLPFPVQSGCTVQVTPCGNVYLADYAAEGISLCITLAGQAGTPVSAICISVIGRLQ